jgi:hypothetical protein
MSNNNFQLLIGVDMSTLWKGHYVQVFMDQHKI